MRKKSLFLSLTLAFGLVIALNVGKTDAGPVSTYFDNYNNAFVEVQDLGTIVGTEWALVAKVDINGSPPDVGVGFSFWNPTYGDLAIHINRDSAWLSHTEEGTWSGSGSSFVLSDSSLHNEINTLTTAPQPDADGGGGDDPTAR